MREFLSLLAALMDEDERIQNHAAERLSNWKVTTEQGLLLIDAAARTFPNDEERTYESIGSKLLKPCWNDPHQEYIAPVARHYDAFCGDVEKQWQALRILTELQTGESLKVLVELLGRPASKSLALELPLAPLIGSFWGGRDPNPQMVAMFPQWFGLAAHLDDVHRVYTLISNCQAAGLFAYDDHPRFVTQCVERAERCFDTLHLQADTEEEHEGRDSKSKAADELEWLLDLFPDMKHSRIDDIVCRALESHLEAIRLFAVTTALSRGIPFSDAKLEELARTPSTRQRLWRILEHGGHLKRFPPRFATPQMLAEANMVRWLEFPTEMGHAPEEIELVHSKKCIDGSEEMVAYFFKFRHSECFDGEWLVGYAGTYPVHGPPTLHGRGTFSAFQPLNSKSIAEHAAYYLNSLTE